MSNLSRLKVWRNYPPFLNTELESGRLYELTEPLRNAIEDASTDAAAGVQMMSLLTAEEDWLDLWGSYFDLTRVSGEDDDTFRERIFYYIFRSLQTVSGVRTLTSYYGSLALESVDVYEFFRELAPVDFGAMSDRTRLQGIDHYTWGAIQITTPSVLSDSVKAILESCVASGIMIYYNPVTRGWEELWEDSGLPSTTDTTFGHTLYHEFFVDNQVEVLASRTINITDFVSDTTLPTAIYNHTVQILTSGYGLDPYGEDYYGSTLVVE